jgi:hypothetical protein
MESQKVNSKYYLGSAEEILAKLPPELLPLANVSDAQTLLDLRSPLARQIFPENSLWIVDKALDKVSEWKELLTAAGFKNFDLYPTGSLVTGQLNGTKPYGYSFNSKFPDAFHAGFIEIDLRCILEEALDPDLPEIYENIATTLSAQYHTPPRPMIFWDTCEPAALFYQYEDIGNNNGIEYELMVNRAPFYDINSVWHDIFSPEEIAWQSTVRAILKKTEGLDYVTDVLSTKALQFSEARWRIVSSFALEALEKISSLSPFEQPLSGVIPKRLVPLVGRWLAGEQGGDGIDKPTTYLTKKVVESISQMYPEVISPPPAPQWVNEAQKLQSQLRTD